jgi:NADPH-dependent glutamate synthase beta subunit-like oxidoreductase
VARDLAPLGYEVTVLRRRGQGGRLHPHADPALPPARIGDRRGSRLHPRHGREVPHFGERVDSLKALLAEGYDAVFVGTGAPRGRDLDVPGRKEAAANIHIGIDWLANVSFGHVTKIGKRVIVLGGGNTAMDCCRTPVAWAAKT